MTIRDRIFDRLDELGITQKEFSEKTGIPQWSQGHRIKMPGDKDHEILIKMRDRK